MLICVDHRVLFGVVIAVACLARLWAHTSNTRNTSTGTSNGYNEHVTTGASSIKDIVSGFIRRHSVRALESDCKGSSAVARQEARKFIVTELVCSHSVGNKLLSFLNHLALAVILDRTIIISVSASCDDVIALNPWVPSASKLLAGTTCLSGILREALNTSVIDLADVYENPWTASAPMLACCGLDAITHLSLKFEGLDRLQASALLMAGANLQSSSATTTLVAEQRARALFGSGDILGYAHLLHASVSFSASVRHWNRQAFKSLANYASSDPTSAVAGERQVKMLIPIIGVHLRHQDVEDMGHISIQERACIASVVTSRGVTVSPSRTQTSFQAPTSSKFTTSQKNDHQCVIVLATDREQTYIDMSIFVKSLNCRMVRSAKTLAEAGVVPSQAGSGNRTARHEAAEVEHGPYASGFLALADIHMLSHVDAFIGSSAGNNTYASSFSLLAAVAMQSHSIPTSGVAKEMLFLPNCSSLSYNGEVGSQPRSVLYKYTGIHPRGVNCSEFVLQPNMKEQCPGFRSSSTQLSLTILNHMTTSSRAQTTI
jgi:hypothetical protein